MKRTFIFPATQKLTALAQQVFSEQFLRAGQQIAAYAVKSTIDLTETDIDKTSFGTCALTLEPTSEHAPSPVKPPVKRDRVEDRDI